MVDNKKHNLSFEGSQIRYNKVLSAYLCKKNPFLFTFRSIKNDFLEKFEKQESPFFKSKILPEIRNYFPRKDWGRFEGILIFLRTSSVLDWEFFPIVLKLAKEQIHQKTLASSGCTGYCETQRLTGQKLSSTIFTCCCSLFVCPAW